MSCTAEPTLEISGTSRSQSLVMYTIAKVNAGLFCIFILNQLYGGTEYTLLRFADDAQLERVAHAPADCAAVERHQGRLDKWISRNLKKFKQEKHKALSLRNNNLLCQIRQGTDQESRFTEKDLRLLVNVGMATGQQSIFIAKMWHQPLRQQ